MPSPIDLPLLSQKEIVVVILHQFAFRSPFCICVVKRNMEPERRHDERKQKIQHSF